MWGAEGPSTFDCSGLTSFAYAAAGITIPRVSRSQFAAYAGMRPVDSTHLVPGDLVFFADNPRDPGTIHHVGLYIGRGLMVEAPHTRAVVRTTPNWRPSNAGAGRPAPGRPDPVHPARGRPEHRAQSTRGRAIEVTLHPRVCSSQAPVAQWIEQRSSKP